MRGWPRLAALRIALVLLVPVSAARAQAVGSLDAGYAYVRFTGFQGSGATTLSPTIQYDSPLMLARATGSFSRFESARWSSSGSAGLSAFSPAYRGARIEVAGSGNATAYRATRTAQALGQARLHVHGDSIGGWLGAGTGTSRYGASWQPHTLLDAGAWARSHGVTGSVALSSATYTFWDSTMIVAPNEAGGIDTTYSQIHRTGYLTDAVANVSVAHGPLDVELVAGFRPIARYVSDRRWTMLTATAWVRPNLAIVAAAGRQPESPLQNLAGLRFAALSVRIGGRARARQAVPDDERSRATDFTIVANGPATTAIYVQAPGAASVEVASGFTAWTPRALRRIGRELWVVALPIEPGTYDVVIRIDGGAWTPPPGVPAFDDEFNGRVGRIVIGSSEPAGPSGT